MRQQQNSKNRMRGRSRNKPSNNLNRNYESNGPDVKVRGNAAHIAEKYTALARDALSSGDSVIAENYLQHAEHYNRIVLAAQAQREEAQASRNRQSHDGDDQPDVSTDDDSEDQFDSQADSRSARGSSGNQDRNSDRNAGRNQSRQVASDTDDDADDAADAVSQARGSDDRSRRRNANGDERPARRPGRKTNGVQPDDDAAEDTSRGAAANGTHDDSSAPAEARDEQPSRGRKPGRKKPDQQGEISEDAASLPQGLLGAGLRSETVSADD